MGDTGTVIHKGRVFRVVREEAELPNGRRARLDLVRHPGAAAVVPVSGDGKALLLRQYRHAAGGWLWEIPAGTLEPGEPPLECARRELAEETGFEAARFTLLTTLIPCPGYSDERISVYLALELTPAVQSLDADEVITVCPTPLEEAVRMVHAGEICDAKSIAGILLAAARLSRTTDGELLGAV